MKNNVKRSKFRCSTNRIEIIITYACNMRCINCDAMCTQAPTNEKMSIEQIERFISESVDINKKWKYIRILGGEPTTHKDFDEILSRLLNYKNKYSPSTIIQVVTNGHGDFVNKVIQKIPPEIEVENSNKVSNYQPDFSHINCAPIDTTTENKDFSDGCWITSICGMTLDSAGFYPCSVAASTDRVIGFDNSIKILKDCNQDSMKNLLSIYCRYCGHYPDRINNIASYDLITDDDVDSFELLHKIESKKRQTNPASGEPVVSKSWSIFLDSYKKNKPYRKKYNKDRGDYA